MQFGDENDDADDIADEHDDALMLLSNSDRGAGRALIRFSVDEVERGRRRAGAIYTGAIFRRRLSPVTADGRRRCKLTLEPLVLAHPGESDESQSGVDFDIVETQIVVVVVAAAAAIVVIKEEIRAAGNKDE